ncbi:MAG: MBL fold metallo-hydrolase [Pseudomonadales bacterium]|nr:MBL fold metallo-hydrolase [Pseudomonadales bacterium]
MKITHFLYNAFIIESGVKKLAIDPGGKFFYYLRPTTLIPKAEWGSVTHILATHGDPDHYWHIDRVAEASGAEIVLNRTMVQERDGAQLALGPRSQGLAFDTPLRNLHTLQVGQTIEVGGVSVTGVAASHGPLLIKIGPFSKMETPGPEERIGWGALGFLIELDGKSLLNLGDTLLLESDWESIPSPDLLMIPIGGKEARNTMDVEEALRAVEVIKPKAVIPTHYNMPALFSRKYGPADDGFFKQQVEKLGASCQILHSGESISL